MSKISSSARMLCAAAVMALITSSAAAQTAAQYPSKPVRVIVPYAPGGGTTAAMRVYADFLTANLGQSFIIDNRAGGNTVIGSEAMVRATPDGYTLLMVTNTHVIAPWLQTNLPYNTLKDFAGVSMLARNDHMLVVHPSVPVNTLNELIAYARKNGDKVNAAVTGLGTVNHLETVLFMQATGTKFTVVPYKGGGTAITDMLSGAVQLSINTVSTFAPHIRAGKLKGIAISGDKRNPVVPDTPTFSEGGMKGFVAANWYALLAPAATPRDIRQKLNEKVAQAQGSPEVVGLLAKQGVTVFSGNLAQTEALIRSDFERIGKVVKENNIKAEAE